MATSTRADRLTMSKSGAPLYGRQDGVGVLPDTASGTGTTDGLVAVANGCVSRALEPSLLCEHFEDFLGYVDIPMTGDTVVNHPGPWFVKDTSSAGSPTIGIVGDADHGQFELTCDTQNEVQALTLYWKDEQNIDSTQEPVMIVRLKFAAQPNANTKMLWGFASAQNDTADSVAQNAWLGMIGASLNLYAESDDATLDNDDKDTGVDLVAATFYEFKISMAAADGASSQDIRMFYRATLGGDWTALTGPGTTLAATTFKVLADTALQPYITLTKNSAAAESIVIDYVHVYWKRS